MIAQADVYQAAVKLLHDLPPYEQCRHIVQMVHDGSLSHEQGLQLLYLLVDYESDASTRNCSEAPITMSRNRAFG
jgi:hypothetical protein